MRWRSRPSYVAAAEGFWKRLTAETLQVELARVRESLWESALGSVGVDDPSPRSAFCRTATTITGKTLHALSRRRRFAARAARAREAARVRNQRVFRNPSRKIALLRIGEFFDAIFIADEVGMLKPDPLLFAHACTTLGGSPSHRRNGRATVTSATFAVPREAGLFTIWLNLRDDRCPPERLRPTRPARASPRRRRPVARLPEPAAGP